MRQRLNVCKRLRVKPGAQNANTGLYLGKDYVYALIGSIEGAEEQVIVVEIKSSRVIAGVNINLFEEVK